MPMATPPRFPYRQQELVDCNMTQRIEPILTAKDRHVPDATRSQTGPQEIRFSGSGKEYFGIWIVNVILSIITIGIYSAWAKVRRETYFKNNTKIADTGFGYHATGLQIFKGRLIAFVVLVVVNLVATFLPLISAATFPLIIFLIPWVLNNSMRFSARMTSYRNIRFNWHGTYWKTFWFFVIAPIISVVSLGILMPLISKAYYTYFARSHSYGTSNFSCEPEVKDYYFAFVMGVFLPSILVTFAITLFVLGLGLDTINPSGAYYAIGQIALLAIVIAIFFTSFVYNVLCRNLMMKSLVLVDVASFDSEISPVKYVWIHVSNLVFTVFSLGLLLPWAKVRLYRYLANCSKIKTTGDLDKFVDQVSKNKSSFGEELAEIEGLEVTI
jgi:uncharacterized membrane protein YjgN (DUF898 family)